MAALQDLDSQLQLANTLSPSDLPAKLRCASCNRMAVFAWKLPCCDQMICEPCHRSLANKCPVCEHSPLEENSCTEAKALRNTIRAFLKKEQIKREKINQQDNSVASATATPITATEPEPTPRANIEDPQVGTVVPTSFEASTNGIHSEADKIQEQQEGGEDQTYQTGADAVKDEENQSEADSDSSSVEIHLGDDNDLVSKPTYGPNSVTQQDGREAEQNIGGSDQANGTMQESMYSNGQNQGMTGFNAMGFDPNTFQQMQQMMLQGGMSGMPGMNMMNMPGMGDMNTMMQNMFNNGFNNFGMNGMAGMNMGMGMGFGNMGFGGGFNGSTNFAGNGYYPNGGYNQRQMHNAQYSNQYQRGFRRGNYQQRSYGRGYHRNNYHEQHNPYGQNDWSNHGDQFMQANQMQAMNGDMQQYKGQQQQSDSNQDTVEASNSDAHRDGETLNGHHEPDTQTDSALNENTANTDASHDQAVIVSDATENQSAQGLEQAVEEHRRDVVMMQADQTALDQSAHQDIQVHSHSTYNEAYEQGPFQNHHGQPGRGRPFVRGRGGWRGRGNFGTYGSYSHAQVGAAVTLTSAAPPENAPTGPKAMREGQAAPFGQRGGFRGVPTRPAAHAQVNGDHTMDDVEDLARARSRSRSFTRSRSRSPRAHSASNGHEKQPRYRERSYSDRVDDYNSKDKKSWGSSHRYEDEAAPGADEKTTEDSRAVERSRDTSVDSSHCHRSRRDKDKHRSSRPHRERSRERRHRRHRSRSPQERDDHEVEPNGADAVAEQPDSEALRKKARSERHRERDRERERDYDHDSEKRRDKDQRKRERSKDRKRKRSQRDRSASPDGEHYSEGDEREYRSSRRSRKEKKPRYRDHEDDDGGSVEAIESTRRRSLRDDKRHDYREDHGERGRRRSSKASRNDEHDRPYEDGFEATNKQATSVSQVDDVGFSILGRSSNRNKADRPPTGPAAMRPPPTGPRGQPKAAPSPPTGPAAERHRRFSESSNKSASHTPATPTAAVVDPYQAEREKRNRERMAREQQRGKKQEADFVPPTGPRRWH